MRPLHFSNSTFVRRTALAMLVATSLVVAVAQAGAAWQPRATTERVSVATSGSEASDGSSYEPAFSADGRYVTFYSMATDLVSGDTNGVADIFVHDRQTGITERVSVATDGSQATGGNTYLPALSSDGRYVSFSSQATNLVSGDTNGATDIFVHDRQTDTTERVSVATGGNQATGSSWSYEPALSADGRFVTFESQAADLVSGDTNSFADIFVHDRQTGVTERVSVATNGSQATGGNSYEPALSADGRYVTFYSTATDLVSGDTNGVADIFVHDRQTDTTERVSVSTAGSQATVGPSFVPAISADGRYVTFQSSAADLVSGDTNGETDIFVHDRQTGVTERVSVATGGAQTTAGSSKDPALSADGRYVSFYSTATDLVSGDTNGVADIFVHDRQTGFTQRVSGATGPAGNYPAISADGRCVAFQSPATDLVSGDTNGKADIFVRNILPADAVGIEVEGTNRYATAIAASKNAYPSGADTVVIATGMNWPDALGGAALAGVVEGPLLLTEPGALPAAVVAELTRLGAKNAYILGGTAAVGDSVKDALDAKLSGTVVRLSGSNRYTTANKVADEVIRLQGVGFAGDAFVATGSNFPDALGASPLAAAWGAPILLADTNATPYLPSKVKTVVILGGASAITGTTESAIRTALGTLYVSRIGGTSRYDTAAKIADYGVAQGLRWDGVGIATGAQFPDGLSGGAMLGKMGSVMLLTEQARLDSSARQRLSTHRDDIGTVYFIGGTSAVDQTVRNEVAKELE